MNESLAVDPPFAGFWRRLGAFVIDGFLLGLAGLGLGYALFDFFVGLGPWGRLFGFSLALGYFAALNSRIGNGQTLGKRLLGIKVLGLDGRPLSFARAAMRFSVLGLPWFLNNAWFPPAALAVPWVNLLALLVFGAGLAILYLFIFNRPTRRSLHDLAAGSYVIRVDHSADIATEPVKRAHQVALALIAMIALALPSILGRVVPSETFAPLVEAFQAVNKLPDVQYAQIQKGWSRTSDGLTTYIQVNAFVSDPGIDDAKRAGRLARTAMQIVPSSDVNVVQVNLIYGFDIGLASAFRSHTHAHSPRDWAAR